MSDNKKKILEMLSENKINADEAYRLLSTIDNGKAGQSDSGREGEPKSDTSARGKPKYLRVTVLPGDKHTDPARADRVNVRVPMSLIRAGIKLKSVLPGSAKKKVNEALHEKGVNLDIDDIKPDSLDGILETLKDFSIDVDDNTEKVKIFVE